MKAMILAAGLGTRLRPLTDTRPKALVEVAGLTLLELTLSRLRSFGVGEVIINVHHFADMIVDYLRSHDDFGMRIEISREDDLLLDTGGGLKKAAWFFLDRLQRNASANAGEPFILHNVDVISAIDLRRMLEFHNERRALATLAVQARESSRQLLFDGRLQLRGRSSTSTSARAPKDTPPQDPSMEVDEFSGGRGLQPPHDTAPAKDASAPKKSNKRGQQAQHSLAFSGIHVISPRLFPLIIEQGAFSIIDAYMRLALQGEKILAFRADEYYWRDLGRPSDLSQAALDLQQQKFLGVDQKRIREMGEIR